MPVQFADRRVVAAQVAQLDRVNGHDDQPVREIPLMGRQGAKAPAPMPAMRNIPPHVSTGEAPLMQEIQRLQAENNRLRAELATYQQRDLATAGPKLNNRPVITAQQAAKKTGLSIAQISRYCNDGWEAEKDASGRWLIYADQPLTKRTRGKKRRK